MWEILWKEKRYAWVKTLLGIGKIAISIVAWIVVYSLYIKSEQFVVKAKEIMQTSEGMEHDVLGTEKIQMVYMSGVFLNIIILAGTVILFWCMMRSGMRKKYSRIGFLQALGYKYRDVLRYYTCQIVMDTIISAGIAVFCAMFVWNVFIVTREEYMEMLAYVKMDSNMELSGIVYAIALAFVIQMLVLLCSLRDVRKKNIRELLTDK